MIAASADQQDVCQYFIEPDFALLFAEYIGKQWHEILITKRKSPG